MVWHSSPDINKAYLNNNKDGLLNLQLYIDIAGQILSQSLVFRTNKVYIIIVKVGWRFNLLVLYCLYVP